MEEILASIRRIIAEDEQPPAAEPEPIAAHTGGGGDVLELTEALNEDGSVRRVTPNDPHPPESPPPPVERPEPPRAAEPHPALEPFHPPEPSSALENALPDEPELPRPGATDRIVSSTTSGAAAASFARLASVPRERRRDDILLGAGERTLEDIVRDTLRPLLRDWLDANLPSLVERLVRQEIARVVGDAGLH